MDLDVGDAFYVSEDLGLRGALRLRLTSAGADFDDLVFGLSLPQAPIEFTVSTGTRPHDVIYTEYVGLRLVSPRFVSCLTANGYGGWRTYPVRFTRAVPPVLADYVGLQVTGRTGPIDSSRSERLMLPIGPGSSLEPHLKGLYPTPGSWDGNDLFLLAGTAHFGITSSVRDALVGAGVRGPEYTRLTEVTMLDWDLDED